MKKQTVKKLAAIMLSAVGMGALSFGVAGCVAKSTALSEPENIEITRLAPPTDGSLPTAHTCAENLAYINYVFDSQTQYHSYSYGITAASIATQTTRTFRDYKDGILLTTDLTYSSMVKGGTQTCTVTNAEGESEVYFRTSGVPEADTLPTQASWSEEAPLIFSEHSYHYTYGLLPTELFNYIVNEQNIIDSQAVKVNSDGTYTQSFTLDPVASTYFYQFGMKTRGGLSGYPDFESITFSVTFDGNWRILSSDVHEVSKINKGVVISSISDFTTQYWYGDDHFDSGHFAYYDSYYKQYIGDDSLEAGGSVDEKPIIDVTNVLSNGFSQIMNGGAQYQITAQLGKTTYTGYAFVSLDLANPLETLALKVSLGKSLKEQGLFLEYACGDMKVYCGNDFALSANLAEVTLAVGQFEDIINGIKAVFTKPDQSMPETGDDSDDGDMLSAVMDAMEITAGEKQAVLTLKTDDLLGLGLGVDLRLVFGINNNEITFRGGTLGGLALGGETIDLSLTILTSTAPEINIPEKGDCADLSDYIADIHSLLGSDLLKLSASLHGDDEAVKTEGLKGVNIDLESYVDLYGLTLGADIAVSYTYLGHKISAAVSVWYIYNAANGGWGQAMLQLNELNGTPRSLKLKCDIEELYNALETLLTFGGESTGAATNGLVSIINGALSADVSSIITELSANGDRIRAGISIDALLDMFNVNAGVPFGSCALTYSKGSGIYGGSLSAELPALGFNMVISGADGSVQQPDFDGCLDLVYAIDDVRKLMDADLLRAEISLDGSAESVSVAALHGIEANLTAYLNTDGIAVAAVADFSYTYGGQKISAEFTAFYELDDDKYGSLIISLTHINGKAVNANVCCNIYDLVEAVKTLLGYAGVTLQPFDGGHTEGLEEIIVKVISADFAKLLPVLQSDASGLKLAVNADEALSLFGINVGMTFGNINLAYNCGEENLLTAYAPSFGLSVALGGAVGNIEKPAPNNCLDLTNLVNTVNGAWEQVNGIIEGESLAFEISRGETYLSLDGILVEIWGEGEICWKKGREYVALDLYAAITERGSDVIAIKLIYDKNAVDTPLVRFALNGVGIDVYREDIDGVVNGFNEIYNKIAPLLGMDTESSTVQSSAPAAQSSAESGNDKLTGLIFKVLSGSEWIDVLNRCTLTSDGKSVVLSYISQMTSYIEIKTDGALELNYYGDTGNRFSLGGGLTVISATGGLVPSIESKLQGCKMSSSKTDGSAAFIRLAYDYLFEAIDAIGVENILGSNTYTVAFALIGDNCNIKELEGVKIDARIYVTGEKGEQGRLAEGDLDIEISGVVVRLNVITERRGNNTYFYMNLHQVADIKLPDLKFMATQYSLFETFAALLKTINNTNVLDLVGSLVKDGENNSSAQSNGGAGQSIMGESTLDAVCDMLSKLLDFNFSEAVIASEADGVLTATIDLDNIAKQLGYKTGVLGTVEAVINHDSHSMKTSGKTLVTDVEGNTQLKEWISLLSELAPRRDYAGFERSDYISIEFLPTMIEDFIKLATDDNGNVYNSFTFSGSLSAKLVGLLDVKIDNLTVTAAFDSEKGLVLSAVMHVNQTKVLGMGISEGTVGFTYQNGMLTLAKGLNTSKPEAKVMTFDYFMDNMLVKDSSVLQWWLDISGWNLVMGFVNVEVNSGLTSPQDIYLYKASASKEEQEISMYDYVESLRVIINGNQTAVFGDYTALEKDLGVYDNYYGFALNAGAVTGGVLTKLYAAITRNDSGINGIKASGAVQSYITFSADLQYKEGLESEYVLGTTLGADVTAPSMYDLALGFAADSGYIPDFDHYVKNPAAGYDEKFGCLSVTSGNSGYEFNTDYSRLLYTHVLTVIGLDGSVETIDVRHGSTVYLYDNNFPVYTDNGKSMRLLYSLSNGVIGDTSFVMNGDTTVYALQSKAVTVFVHNGEEVLEVSSFVGDRVPMVVDGLDTLSAPVYEDGTPVGENDRIGNVNSLHIYGNFVKTEVVVNYVKYTFDAQTLSYTASGKAAGFNDYYSTKGNTLVLENRINGYPVTAIAASAFANTEDKPIVSVIVPENIVTVGENAFLNNVDMQSAVFLAPSVTFLGKDGSSTTMPFYGCSLSSDDEKTALNVYYNSITAGGGKWNHFRYVSKVFSFNFYIGDNGGAAYGAGSWQYINYNVNVDLGGVAGSTLTEQAVSDILSPYFPAFGTGEFVGSAKEAQIMSALEAALTQFEIMRDGIIYTCAVTASVERNGCNLTVTYGISYKRAAQVYIRSAYDFTLYGVDIKANTLTQMLVPVDGDEITLASPAALATHVFAGWTVTEENGVTVYNAQWTAKEFTLKLRLTRGGTDTNIVHIDTNSYRINGSGFKGTTDVTEIRIYGGEATFTVTDKVLTIVTGDVTYTIYVNEASVFGVDKNSKRNINSDVNGTITVIGDMTLTLAY